MKRFMELFDDPKKIQNFYGSKLIATYTNDLPKNDLDYVLEGLFKKEDGTFFLAGESGPRGRYAKNESLGGKVGGEDVYILSPEEAKEWIELTQQGDNAAIAMKEHKLSTPQQKKNARDEKRQHFGEFWYLHNLPKSNLEAKANEPDPVIGAESEEDHAGSDRRGS